LTVGTVTAPLDRLRTALAEIADLQHAEMLLDWDSRVSMPHAGARARADASATVGRIAHERFISDEVGELLDELAPLGAELEPGSADAALIRVTRREWERFRRVPAALAGEMRHASGIAVAAWDEAKAASDFAQFAPHLEHQLELKHRYVECFPPGEETYDTLLDDYEQGMKTAEVRAVFDQLPRALDGHLELMDVAGPPICEQLLFDFRLKPPTGAPRCPWCAVYAAPARIRPAERRKGSPGGCRR